MTSNLAKQKKQGKMRKIFLDAKSYEEKKMTSNLAKQKKQGKMRKLT